MDLYEFSNSAPGTTTPTAATEVQPQPTLEEEVNQVVGQLGRLWGGFKKQSTAALQTARKDFSHVVVQAQAELGKMNLPPASDVSLSTTSASDRGESSSGEPTEEAPSSPSTSAEKGKRPESPSASTEETTGQVTPTQPTFNSFLSRLQSSLPPQLAPESITQTFQNIQKQVQPALANAQNVASNAALQAQNAASHASQTISQVDVGQVQRSLSVNLQKLQEAQAPMLAQAEKLAEEARQYLKDAVKVVPPEGGAPGAAVAWDGSDIWMFPGPEGQASATAAATDDMQARRSGDTVTYARVKRADIMLARLKYDPTIIRFDPEVEQGAREGYLKFVGEEIDGQGGILGDTWSKKVGDALAEEGPDGDGLRATFAVLAPSEMTEETFWQRYFFRLRQIQEEEEKRKALLEAPTHEEELTWDDEDESESAGSPVIDKGKGLTPPQEALAKDTNTLTPVGSSTPTPVVEKLEKAPSSEASKAKAGSQSAASSSVASPRESEESFDVVSAGVHSKDASSEDSEEEEDSDWE